ncbi:hypothetical protein K8942_01235 [Candidatus Peribacteria bacterium]|nr:MAG: hypothetical protein K8942_01235 [Candidatus Peribacteria bacterium]
MATQQTGFFDLFSAAWEHMKERRTVLLTGIAIFSVLTALTQVSMTPGIDPGAGFGFAVGSAIVGIVSTLYYLLAVTRQTATVGDTFSAIPSRILPFVGLTLLVILKTYVWLVFVGGLLLLLGMFNPLFVPVGLCVMAAGVVCMVIFMPRYILSNVIWVMEGKGLSASLRRSFELTQGYFGTVLLYLIILFVLSTGLAVVFASVGGIIGGQTLANAFNSIASQCYTAFSAAFMVHLAQEFMKHPRSAR